MKSLLKTVTAIGFIILAAACDHTYQVEYEIRNISGTSITISVDPLVDSVITSTIANDTRLTFLDDFGIGSTTEDHLDGMESLFFELSILNGNGEVYNKDIQDISNWEKIYPEKNQSIGRVRLSVRPQDFD